MRERLLLTHTYHLNILTHETSREVRISANLSINSDVSVDANHLSLMSSEGIVETVTEHDHEGEALTKLVRSSGRAGSPDSTKLV